MKVAVYVSSVSDDSRLQEQHTIVKKAKINSGDTTKELSMYFVNWLKF
jgi:hypothetical protein